MILQPLNEMPQRVEQMLRRDRRPHVLRRGRHKLRRGARRDVLAHDPQLWMRREQPRHALRVEARLRILLRVDVVRSAQRMLLAMDAQHHAALLHRPQHLAADQIIHRHAMLRVRRAMRRVVFARAQPSRGRPVANHRRRGLPREVKRHDQLLKRRRTRRAQLRRVALDAPAIALRRT